MQAIENKITNTPGKCNDKKSGYAKYNTPSLGSALL